MQGLKQKQPPTIKSVLIALAILGLIFWGLFALGSQPPKPQQTTYEATLGKYGSLDPKTVYVQVGVKNTGQVAHAASCVLTVASDSGAYNGAEQFSTRELQPGQDETYTIHVSVSDNGADYIADGYVECKDK